MSPQPGKQSLGHDLGLGSSPPRRPHALVIPFPAQGHIGPMMHLSIKLASEAGFVITFVNTHHNHESLKHLLLEPRFREQGLDIHFAQVVNDKRDSGDTTGSAGLVELLRSFYQLTPAFEELVESLLLLPNQQQATAVPGATTASSSSSSPPGLPPLTCIISDLYLYFTQDIANKYGVKRMAFWTASATMLATAMSVVAHGHRAPPPGHEGSLITWIPGAPPLRRSELNEFLLNPDHTVDLMYEVYYTSYKRLPETTCIAINTFEELEPEALKALREDNAPVKVFSVGPLLPDAYLNASTGVTNGAGGMAVGLGSYPVASLWKEDNECLQWLNRQAPGSVLYVSFGSIAIMSGEQFEELAMGLEESGSAVLWVLRPDLMAMAGGQAVFPEGFLERTKDKMFMVEWAPQLQVLAHPAVGGFLSHCGWNSTIESLSAGVPTLGWPYFSDQMLNNRLLVDVWGLGLEVQRCGGKNTLLVPRGEIACKVVALMKRGHSEGGLSKVKEAAIHWRDAAYRASQQPHGSSNVAIGLLVKSFLD